MAVGIRGVRYRCAQCHHPFEVPADSEPTACPNCGAEAGLERVHGVPPSMRMFGFLLAGVIAAAVTGGVLSRIAG